jgi:hypothetical protein
MEQSTRPSVAGYLADLAHLEEDLEALLTEYAEAARGDTKVADLLGQLPPMAAEHREALTRRLSELGTSRAPVPSWIAPLPRPPEMPSAPWSSAGLSALHGAYSALSHMALGYAILHAVAHRFFDGPQEGATADLAEDHLRRYAGVIQEINQLVSDAVVAELGEVGQECQCQCPSCGIGVCLCAPHGTNTINQIWQETGPPPRGPGIGVRRPRSGSAALTVLREGDRVVAADGREIGTEVDLRVLQEAIRAHASGEPVELQIVQGEGRRSTVPVVCP